MVTSAGRFGPHLRPERRYAQPVPHGVGPTLRLFLSRTNAQMLVAWVVVATLWRASLGRWSWADLLVVVVLLAAQPFGEWFVHRYLMHRGRVQFVGRQISLPLRDEHSRHHGDPHVEHFMPIAIVLAVAASTTALAIGIAPTTELAATAAVVLAAELLAYVWVHYLLHADYRPRTRWFREQRRTHLRHHDGRDDVGFGVVTPIADIVMRTR